MARILVVEDEPRLAVAVQIGLQDELHAVDVARAGPDALALLRATPYDLVVLDRMLPGLDGLEVCRRLRAARDPVPVLMLTARDATADVVAGLDAGADDYLTKPFAFDELLARVRSLLRRGSAQRAARYRAGPVELDAAAHRVWVDGDEIELTAKEFQILEALVRHAGTPLSKERIAAIAWERDLEPGPNAIEAHLSTLRRKLGRDLIHTLRGVGYVLDGEAR